MDPDLSGFLPTVLLFLSIIVSITIGLVHEFYLMPPISRKLRGAKWGKGVTAFIQDLSGNVLCITSKKDLPEGIIKTKRGYFMLPMVGTPISRLPQIQAYQKRGPGRPPKESADDTVPPVPDTEKERAEYAELYGMMVHVPILRGLGKQVFFGCIESPMLGNLWSIAHASLLETKRFIPANMTKTQLDALATGEPN